MYSIRQGAHMVFMGVVFIFFGWQDVMPPALLAAGDGIAPVRRGHSR
jgi:hypothetical protein